MSYTKERDEFIGRLVQELQNHPIHIVTDLARQVLRAASTLDRLAVAACNGEYPADNGERKTKTCSQCEIGWAPEFLNAAGVCGDCRKQAALAKRLKSFGIVPIFGGDPRGYVVKLRMPSGQHNTMGGAEDGIGVPTRNR